MSDSQHQLVPHSGAAPALRATVPLHLDYEALSRRALREIQARPVRLDRPLLRGELHVGELQLRPVGERVEALVEIDARLSSRLLRSRARLRLLGVPRIDDGRLRLEALELTSERVSNPLLAMALSFARPTLLRRLERTLSVDLGDHLETAKATANERLRALEALPGVTVRGALSELRIRSVEVTPEALVVVIDGEADARVEVHEIPEL